MLKRLHTTQGLVSCLKSHGSPVQLDYLSKYLPPLCYFLNPQLCTLASVLQRLSHDCLAVHGQTPVTLRVPTCHAQLAGNLGLFDLTQAWDVHVSNSNTGEQTFEPEQLCVSTSPFHFFLMHKFTIWFLSTTRGSLSIWHWTSWLLRVVKSSRNFHQVVFLVQSLKEWFDIECSDGSLNLCRLIYYLFREKKWWRMFRYIKVSVQETWKAQKCWVSVY